MVLASHRELRRQVELVGLARKFETWRKSPTTFSHRGFRLPLLHNLANARLNAARALLPPNSSSREADRPHGAKYETRATAGGVSITALRLERARQRGLGAAAGRAGGRRQARGRPASLGERFVRLVVHAVELIAGPRRKAFGKFGGRSDSPEKLRKSDATTSSNVCGLWAAAPNLSQPMPEVVRLFFDSADSAAKQAKSSGCTPTTRRSPSRARPAGRPRQGGDRRRRRVASTCSTTPATARIAPVAVGENCWAATIVVTRHPPGQPYSPMPTPPIAHGQVRRHRPEPSSCSSTPTARSSATRSRCTRQGNRRGRRASTRASAAC